MKIEEVLAKITESQHLLAVYQDIETYLENYLPSDTTDSLETINVSGPCFEPTVAVSAIENVLEELSKLKASVEKALTALNALETRRNGKSKPTIKRKPATKRKSAKSAK